MQDSLPPMRAAIDIGSNTIHIVVARCTPDDLEIVADEVEMVRIGESVTATGDISPQKLERSISTLRQYKELAEQYGAEEVLVVATEAIRKAKNSREFVDAIQRELGLTVHLISGNAEATLTFLGATYEVAKDADASARIGVMDLGGGSTELVLATHMQIDWKISIPIGSGWLHDRYLPSNPPTRDELAVAHTFVRTYFQGLRIKQVPPKLVVTGGSANSLLYLARNAYHLDEETRQLTADDLMHCEGLLSALPAEEIAQRYGQLESRARILPAGAVIIREAMLYLHLDEISVSPHGIREGALLARERYGEAWLEQIEQTQSDTVAPSGNGIKGQPLEPGDEPFVSSGRRVLQERMKKLLDWRDEVLKNEDIEAVHKMRVATRRLRAALDAYQPCCEPKQFKKAYKQVKAMADVLGEARDTDVMMAGLYKTLEHVSSEERAGVQWLIDRLHTYREQRQQALEDFFADLDEDELRETVEACIQKGAGQNG